MGMIDTINDYTGGVLGSAVGEDELEAEKARREAAAAAAMQELEAKRAADAAAAEAARMENAQANLEDQRDNPYAPFGAYLPGDLSHMMASWMPGQTASPVLPNNPYAPWAGADWANRFAAEDRRGQWGTPEAAPQGLAGMLGRESPGGGAVGPRVGGTAAMGGGVEGPAAGVSGKRLGGVAAGLAGPATGAKPLNPLALAEWLASGGGTYRKGR